MKRRSILKLSAYCAGMSSIPISLTALQGCKPSGEINWVPDNLSPKQAAFLSETVETIIPASENSPGAADLHIPEFIDLFLGNCILEKDRTRFLHGLDLLLRQWDGSKKGLKGFILDVDEQAFSDQKEDHDIYRLIKQLTIIGYYTSEEIMTNHLNYNAIPGRYDGCIDMEKDDLVYVDDNISG